LSRAIMPSDTEGMNNAINLEVEEVAVGVHEAGVLPEHTRRNWILCIVLWVCVVAFSVYWLVVHWEPLSSTDRTRGWHTLLLHVVIGVFKTWLLTVVYRDTVPSTIDYGVHGQPQIPRVSHDFIGFGRWVMFTTWSNTLCAVYFDAVAISDGMVMFGSTPPYWLEDIIAVVWDIVFPMSFLVNMIVTHVLYADVARQGRKDKMLKLLSWKSESMHNGFVLFTSLEALFVGPAIQLHNFVVVACYGAAYILFAWINYCRTGVYAYFFLDPRFKSAPCAVLGLLMFLVGLFLVAAFVLNSGREQFWVRVLVFLFAVSTCTWRWPRAATKDDVEGLSSWRLMLAFLGRR